MESAKARAVLYADIFDYPLSKNELERWKIKDNSEFRIHNSEFKKTNGYYYLKGRENITRLREQRKKISLLKLGRARKAVDFLKTIPTIKMIALTGALAMENCKKIDDIDLLIVTKKGTLWLTRFLATVILELKGIRRRPNQKNAKDKICLNMFLEDGYLTLPKSEQDLYGAHEVCQVKPIFERDNTYPRFLRANAWVRKYLPNGIRNQELGIRKNYNRSLFILELLAKYLQLLYMRGKRTNEVITDHILRFHPNDFRFIVTFEYEKRLKKYGKT